jgi:hypothetical protein
MEHQVLVFQHLSPLEIPAWVGLALAAMADKKQLAILAINTVTEVMGQTEL